MYRVPHKKGDFGFHQVFGGARVSQRRLSVYQQTLVAALTADGFIDPNSGGSPGGYWGPLAAVCGQGASGVGTPDDRGEVVHAGHCL